MSDRKDLFPSRKKHKDWMKESIRLAQKAFSEGEVPVGAIVVKMIILLAGVIISESG